MSKEVVLRANPNPVPYGDVPGSTEIAWSAGEVENALVMVSVDGDEAQPFAGGSNGVAAADWIAPGRRYTFTLHGAPAGERLAAIDVEMDGPRRRSDAAPGGTPYLVASPNPVPHQPGAGTTTISWSTGGRGSGVVTVHVDGQEVPVAGGSDGIVEAPWIVQGRLYVFRLYANDQGGPRLGAVTVMMASPLRERAMDITVLATAAGVVAAAVAVPLAVAVRIARRARR